jgi:hypothetical protein
MLDVNISANETSGSMHGKVQVALNMLNPESGKSIIEWTKMVPFPDGYEDMLSVTMDGDKENLVFTGKRYNRTSKFWDLAVGSFGCQLFSSRSEAVTHSLSNESFTGSTINDSGGVGSLLLGLVCLTACISLMVAGVVCGLLRTRRRIRRRTPEPSGGYHYQDRSHFSRSDENTMRATGRDIDDIAGTLSGRSFARGASLSHRTIFNTTCLTHQPGHGGAPGGSAGPV